MYDITNDDTFQKCNDYQSLTQYVLDNPRSPHLQEAMQRIWEIENDAYPKIVNAKTLLAYKEKFPNSHNEQKVVETLNQLLLGANNGTIYDYSTLLRLYPNHERKNEVISRLDYLSFKACKSISDWKDYLHDFPNGMYRQEAESHIQSGDKSIISIEFENCKSISDYNNFMLKYPTSSYCLKAKNKIEDFIYIDAVSSGKYVDYLKHYPKGRYIQNIYNYIEQNATKKDKVVKDVEKDKKKNPIRVFLGDLKERIKKNNLGSTTNWIIAMVAVFAIGIFTMIIINISHRDTQTSNNTTTVNTEIKPKTETTVEESEADTVAYDEPNQDDEYRNNSLKTGAKPYSSFFGRARTGRNYLYFETTEGNDYVIIVKRHSDNKYINHIYINGGDKARLYLPNGTFDVYFYSGSGWNPEKEVGQFMGGFVKGGHTQKEESIHLANSYIEYTLYPVLNGNLKLEDAKLEDALN